MNMQITQKEKLYLIFKFFEFLVELFSPLVIYRYIPYNVYHIGNNEYPYEY